MKLPIKCRPLGNISGYIFKRISACNKIIYFIMCGVRFENSGTKKSVVAIMTEFLGNGTKGQTDCGPAVAARRFVFFLSLLFFAILGNGQLHTFLGYLFLWNWKKRRGWKRKKKYTHCKRRKGGKRTKNIKCVSTSWT